MITHNYKQQLTMHKNWQIRMYKKQQLRMPIFSN